MYKHIPCTVDDETYEIVHGNQYNQILSVRTAATANSNTTEKSDVSKKQSAGYHLPFLGTFHALTTFK